MNDADHKKCEKKNLDLNLMCHDRMQQTNVMQKVFFTNIAICFIQCLHRLQPNAICGAMYHLSSKTILQALKDSKIPCHFIIQKQTNVWTRNNNLNRRKKNSKTSWKTIKADQVREYYDSLIPITQYGSSAVTCLGSCEKDNQSLLHHKFVIFMRYCPGNNENSQLEPFAVWNGSFNFSSNAEKSLENAMILEDECISQEFYKEWIQLQKFTEPLDWKTSKFSGL